MESAKGPAIAGFCCCLLLGAIVLPLSINRDEKDEREHNDRFEEANARVWSVSRGDYECFQETGCNACGAGGQYPLCDELIAQRRIGSCQKSSAMCCEERCYRCIQDDDDDSRRIQDDDDDSRRDRRDDEDLPEFMQIDTGRYSPGKTTDIVVWNGTIVTDINNWTTANHLEFYNATDFSVNEDNELVPIGDSDSHHTIVRRRGGCALYCDRCVSCGSRSAFCNHGCYCSDNNHQPRCSVINGTCYRPTVGVIFNTAEGQRINTTAQKSCGMGDISCAEDFIRGVVKDSTIDIHYEKSQPTTVYIKGQLEYETSGQVMAGYVFGSLFIVIAVCCLIAAIVFCYNDGDCDNLGSLCSCSCCKSDDDGSCCCFSDDQPASTYGANESTSVIDTPQTDYGNIEKPEPGPTPSAPPPYQSDFPQTSSGGDFPQKGGDFPSGYPPGEVVQPQNGLYPPPTGSGYPPPSSGPNALYPPPSNGVSYPQSSGSGVYPQSSSSGYPPQSSSSGYPPQGNYPPPNSSYPPQTSAAGSYPPPQAGYPPLTTFNQTESTI